MMKQLSSPGGRRASGAEAQEMHSSYRLEPSMSGSSGAVPKGDAKSARVAPMSKSRSTSALSVTVARAGGPPARRPSNMVVRTDPASAEGEMSQLLLHFPDPALEEQWELHRRAHRRFRTMLICVFGALVFAGLAITDVTQENQDDWFQEKMGSRLGGSALILVLMIVESAVPRARGLWQYFRAIVVLVPCIWAAVFSPTSGFAKRTGGLDGSFSYLEVRLHPIHLILPMAGPLFDCQHFIVLLCTLVTAIVDVVISLTNDMYSYDGLIFEHIGIWCLLAAFAVITAYDSEKAARVLFIRNRSLSNENKKLAEQVRRQNTQRGLGGVDFSSNAEKLAKLIHAIKVDVSEGGHDRGDLERKLAGAMELLTKGDLFRPANLATSLATTPDVDQTMRKWLLDDIGLAKREPVRRARSAKTIYHMGAMGQAGVGGSLRSIDGASSVAHTFDERISRFLTFVDLDDFNTNLLVHETSEPELLRVVTASALQERNIMSALQIPVNKMHKFLARLEGGYKAENPYHNATHAAMVTWDVQWYLGYGGLGQFLTPLEVFAAIVAAAGHDFRHPGRSNQFLVNRRDPVAVVHNDKSVLERFHCAEVFTLGLAPDVAFFDFMDAADYRTFRATVIHMILCTDVSKHFKHVAKLKTRDGKWLRRMAGSNADSDDDLQNSSTRTLEKSFNRDDEQTEDVRLMLNSVIMMADLGHAAKPFSQHKMWSERVTEEFFQQGDEERKAGLAISPLCDRETVELANSQIGFFDFLVRPLWGAVRNSHPVRGLRSRVLDNVNNNYAQWKAIAAEAKAHPITGSVGGRSKLTSVKTATSSDLDAVKQEPTTPDAKSLEGTEGATEEGKEEERPAGRLHLDPLPRTSDSGASASGALPNTVPEGDDSAV